MGTDLEILIPRLELDGNFYQIVLNKYFNLNDPFHPYWVLDLGSAAPAAE
jgi:hypothetical protein